ncbi:MAG: hypothetical protein QXH13_02335 [Thermoplasmata archaeon]
MAEIVLMNTAKEKILNHALEQAKAHGFEVVGWLVGFFDNDDVFVLDAVPATQYISQSKYGAEASPVEEMNLAMSYPRKVGIVGLYHSHPFRDDYLEATMGAETTPMFHSEIDDHMLSSRASMKKSYLSVVTDGYSLGCFLYSSKGSVQIHPKLVENYSYKNKLTQFYTKMRFEIKFDETLTLREAVIDARNRIVERVETIFMRELKDIEMYPDEIYEKCEINLAYPSEASVKENRIRFVFEGENVSEYSLTFAITPVVFTNRNASALELLELLKEEATDQCLLLFSKMDVEKVRREIKRGSKIVDAYFGEIVVLDNEVLPKIKYVPPHRPIVGRRA